MYFEYAGLTNTGLIRDHNEDAYKLPEDTDSETLSSKGHLYILADGMGGHKKGEVASAVTIETVNSEYYAIANPVAIQSDPEGAIIDALSRAIQKANFDVMEVTEGGGTTIVAAVLYGDRLVTMNVGDSRAYLLRDNQLRLLTRDHSLVSRLVEMGKITEAEASTHPRRNVLYQALGQGTDVEIHTYSEKLQVGDTIILCSDGLWGEVHEEDLKRVLSSAPPRVAVQQLIDLANASGGPDNITAIIIHVTDKAPSAGTSLDDTDPSIEIPPKPNTLPEGKYHVDK
ncbi:MAG: serine/threonine-protein phosphatase [Chloroflexi bacterium]|nr:MAG: serine/threonine-protein phosphatase [Chloroflexota bacterium]